MILTKKTGDTEVTIDGLETFTSYYVKVAAFTKVGSGVSSEKMICTTAQDGRKQFDSGHLIFWIMETKTTSEVLHNFLNH